MPAEPARGHTARYRKPEIYVSLLLSSFLIVFPILVFSFHFFCRVHSLERNLRVITDTEMLKNIHTTNADPGHPNKFDQICA